MENDDEEDPLIGYKEMAELAGVRPNTLRRYRVEGRLPPPDVLLADRPRWRLSTFTAWMESRPGPGTRTDLRGQTEKRDDDQA